jgi:hypothetical protein
MPDWLIPYLGILLLSLIAVYRPIHRFKKWRLAKCLEPIPPGPSTIRERPALQFTRPGGYYGSEPLRSE